ncbi:MAG: DNA-directed RNA polymerase subunit L, partial [Candidatus Diapherotrites archaeon]|nr:DNA-directed RNA polymerase subunit L [Candidatus Diapherotrites archaeon]
MKIEVLNKDKNMVEFKLIGERHSLPSLIKSVLLEDSSVEFVSYKLEHPLDSDSVFVLRTKGKEPSKVLESAIKKIESELIDFEKKVLKAL